MDFLNAAGKKKLTKLKIRFNGFENLQSNKNFAQLILACKFFHIKSISKQEI